MLRFFLVLCCLMSAISAADPLIRSGDTIVFMGDSITQQGAQSPSGYVRLVISGLEANDIRTSAIPAGVSGNKSDQMLARSKGELSKKPTWMTLSCGVNDVWHGAKGVPLEDFKRNILEIIDRAQVSGVKIMILTATMIKENPSHELNRVLSDYNDFLLAVAAERKLPIADLNADMHAIIAASNAEERKGTMLTVDGVQMNAEGNQMMAVGVLRAFGLDDAGIAKARAAWQDIPRAVQLSAQVSITIRQYEQLRMLARKQGRTVDKVMGSLLERAVSESITTRTSE